MSPGLFIVLGTALSIMLACFIVLGIVATMKMRGV